MISYIPGGRYPLLASAHMTILTAKVAGVKHVIACTPPINGEIPAATVSAAHLAGADEIFIIGGTQAVAAMSIGTETIRKVDFLAGPGNAFVAEAKRQLFGEIGIDLLAGPTEVLIVADEHADPFTVATDLLSQAEHGPDSPAVLITNSEKVGRETMTFVEELLKNLPTAALAGTSWRDFGEVIVVDDVDEAYKLGDAYSSEHVQILTQKPREALDKMTNYGALFLGEKTCVSYGDKVSSRPPPMLVSLKIGILTKLDSALERITSCLRRKQESTLVASGWGSILRRRRTRRSFRKRQAGSLVDCAGVVRELRISRAMLVRVTCAAGSTLGTNMIGFLRRANDLEVEPRLRCLYLDSVLGWRLSGPDRPKRRNITLQGNPGSGTFLDKLLG